MAQRKLGKGLADIGLTALLSEITQSTVTTTLPSPQQEREHLLTSQLRPSHLQPRRHFDEDALAELAASISSQGILSPIIVRPLSDDEYEIIAGERRWRAAQIAGLEQVPVLIRHINDQDAMAVALIENIQRRDLNALEEAEALQRLLEEFKLTHQAIAQTIGKSRTAISNLLRLLNLSPAVKELLYSNQLEMGHARTLLALDETQQHSVAEYIINKKLSVRATEDYVRQLHTPKTSIPKHTSIEPQLEELQQRLAIKLTTKVLIKPQANGKGKLVIHYKNSAKLQSIITNLES